MRSSRWDPLGEFVDFQEAMNQVLAESAIRQRQDEQYESGTLGLAIDLLETSDSFVLIASVPGVRPEDVDISVLGDTLTIRGQRNDFRDRDWGTDGHRWLIQERHFGAFKRSVKLPTPVIADMAAADFENGLLTVVLPKAESAKPRSIAVRTVSDGASASAIESTSHLGEGKEG
jgi:HSP20 family protein